MLPQADFHHQFCHWATQPRLAVDAGAGAVARLALVDTVACMLAGREQVESAVAMQSVTRSGDFGRVTPLGGGGGLSLSGAAFVNGVRAHALDFDDYETAGSTHPSAPIFGALLSLAQSLPLSLGALCEAWLVGYEAIVRLGQALGYGHYLAGWHATTTLGPIGVAAAAARALGLDATRMGYAMSLATSCSAGLKGQFGSDAKALHAGLAARSGLQAAFLAEAGATANAALWQARAGFMSVYGSPTSPGLAAVMAAVEWGQATIDYPVMRKPWPSCAYTHRVVEAAEVLQRQSGAARQFRAVTVRMPAAFARVAGLRAPTSPAAARFSTAYCVAVTLLHGRLCPQDFAPAALDCAAHRALAARVVLAAYATPPDLQDMSPAAPDTLELTLADGTHLAHTVSEVRGGATRPLRREEIVDKFVLCQGAREVAVRLLECEGTLAVTQIGLW